MGGLGKVISVFINGSAQVFEQAPSVATLIQGLGLGGKRIALERNGEIVPRSQFPQQMLADGDKLEIVVAVGGG
jgi:sulfur carrier protein